MPSLRELARGHPSFVHDPTVSDQGCSVTSSPLDLSLRVVEDNAGNQYVQLEQTDKEQFSNTQLLTGFARTNCFATSTSTPSNKRFCSRELTLRAFKLGAFSGDNHGTAVTMTLNCDSTDPLKITSDATTATLGE